jgi:hypothetical protein
VRAAVRRSPTRVVGAPPRVPAAFQPTCHIFYGAWVIDVEDGKPKLLGHKERSPLF